MNLIIASMVMAYKIPIQLTEKGIKKLQETYGTSEEEAKEAIVFIGEVKDNGKLTIYCDQYTLRDVQNNPICDRYTIRDAETDCVQIPDNVYFVRAASAGLLGNSYMWWAKQGSYTSNLFNAKIYTEAEAKRMNDSRKSDKAYKVRDILEDEGLFLEKDSQYCNSPSIG